jgi:hypothetical protein
MKRAWWGMRKVERAIRFGLPARLVTSGAEFCSSVAFTCAGVAVGFFSR